MTVLEVFRGPRGQKVWRSAKRCLQKFVGTVRPEGTGDAAVDE
jgi:hypothetical protein